MSRGGGSYKRYNNKKAGDRGQFRKEGVKKFFRADARLGVKNTPQNFFRADARLGVKRGCGATCVKPKKWSENLLRGCGASAGWRDDLQKRDAFAAAVARKLVARLWSECWVAR